MEENNNNNNSEEKHGIVYRAGIWVLTFIIYGVIGFALLGVFDFIMGLLAMKFGKENIADLLLFVGHTSLFFLFLFVIFWIARWVLIGIENDPKNKKEDKQDGR